MKKLSFLILVSTILLLTFVSCDMLPESILDAFGSVVDKEHTHTWLDATCESPMICECGQTNGAALGHDWTAATCESSSVCRTCGTIGEDAKGHIWVSADCNNPKTCSVCQKIEGTPSAHQPGAEASCTTAQTCTACGIQLQPAKGHSGKAAVVENEVEATCETDGSYDAVVYCKDCNTEISRITETVFKSGHTPSAEATCTEPQICTVCAKELVPATGHSYSDKWTTDNSEHWHTCHCGDKSDLESHVFEWIIDVHPTEETPGVKHEECSVCGFIQNENYPIPELNHTHTLEQVDAKANSCSEDGWDAYEYCTSCDYNTKVVLPKTGHRYDNGETVTPAGCTTDGVKKYTCLNDNCSDSYTEKIDSLGHDEISNDAKPATCTEAGWGAYVTCSRCDYSTKVEIPETGHNINDAWLNYDEDGHWNGCSNSGCLAKLSFESHVDSDNDLICDVCGYNSASEVTIKQILDGIEDESAVIFRGTVHHVTTPWDSYFNNITVIVTDGEGNYITLYRLSTNVSVGDVILVTGYVATFSGTKQIDEGAVAVIVDHVEPESPKNVSVSQIKDTADFTKVTFTGIVKSVDTSWDDYHGNMCVTVTDGESSVYVFRLITLVKVGDKITVTGIVDTHNGSKQIGQGAVAVIRNDHVCEEFTDATCVSPKTCVECGKTEGTVTDHSYVDGLCTVCGAKEGVEIKTAIISYSGSTTNMTGNNDASILGLDPIVFSVIGSKGSTNNNVGLNKDGSIRLYSANDSNGAYFTVTAANGYIIKSIKITFMSESYSSYCAAYVNGVAVSTSDDSSTVITVDIDSDSFKLQNVYKSSKDNSPQVRIKSIEIEYYANDNVCEHINRSETRIEATCTSAGSVITVCDDCGISLGSNEIAALGHTTDSGVCARCGKTVGVDDSETSERTLTFDSTDKRTAFTTLEQIWEENGVKLTNNKASSQSDVADYSSPARFYKNSEIIIDCKGLIKLVFDCNNASYATSLASSIGTLSGVEVTVSSDKVTVVLGSSVDSFTVSLSDGQIRVDSITVTSIS